MKKTFSILLTLLLLLSCISPSFAWDNSDNYSELRDDEFIDQEEYTEQFAKIVCIKEVGKLIDKSENITNEFFWYLDKHPDYQKIQSTDQIVSWMQQTSVPSNYPTTIWKYPSNKINAFALPGGLLFITSGLLNQYYNGNISRGEMAFLLSHEFTHARAGHGFSHRNTGILASIFMTAAYLFARNSNNKYVRQGVPVAAAVISIMVLSGISQGDEKFADTIATKEIVAMGYPADSGITLLQKIKGDPKVTGTNEFDERCYFKTHPDLDERIENIKESANNDDSIAQFFGNNSVSEENTNSLPITQTESKINVYVINSNYTPTSHSNTVIVDSHTTSNFESPPEQNNTQYNIISLTPPSSPPTSYNNTHDSKNWAYNSINNENLSSYDSINIDFYCEFIKIYNNKNQLVLRTTGPTQIKMSNLNPGMFKIKIFTGQYLNEKTFSIKK